MYNTQLSIDNNGQFYCHEVIEDGLKNEIMAFVSGYSSGFVTGYSLSPANPKNNFGELRLHAAKMLNEQSNSPLYGKLTNAQVSCLAFRLRSITHLLPMDHSFYFTLENLFRAFSDTIGGKWDTYLGKHNGFKVLFEQLPGWLSENNSYDHFRAIFNDIHYEKTVVASQSVFHSEKLRKIFKKIAL